MTELSMLWTTDAATPEGDQQTSYTQAQDSIIKKILAACSGFEGIAPVFLASLAGTVTGANTVAINTGGAVVDGKVYQNDASLDVNIPSAVGGGNTRIDRIVLRCSWAAFTVRVTRIAGTDAAIPTAPTITQTTGTTYDIMLYRALVNTGGTVTITDERVWANSAVESGTWVPVFGGFSADPTNVVARYLRVGKWCTICVSMTPGTSNGTTFTISTPFPSATVANMTWTAKGAAIDASTAQADPAHISISAGGGGVIDIYKSYLVNSWTNIGLKAVYFTITYETA